MNEEQGQRGDDGRVEEVIRVEDDLNPFDLLPDELLEIIIAQSLSGLSRGSFVRAFTQLQNVFEIPSYCSATPALTSTITPRWKHLSWIQQCYELKTKIMVGVVVRVS